MMGWETLHLSQVSWIRRSDLKILTIGPVVYTRDKRFSPIHRRHVAAAEDVWILKVIASIGPEQIIDGGLPYMTSATFSDF